MSDATDSTPEEHAAGGRKPRAKGAVEMLQTFLKIRDLMGAVYVFGQNKPVQVFLIDGWPMVRDLLRSIKARRPTLADLITAMRDLQMHLKKAHEQLEEIHWMFEDTSEEFLEVRAVKSIKEIYGGPDHRFKLETYVLCDEYLQRASRSTNELVFARGPPDFDVTVDTVIDQSLFVNIYKMPRVSRLFHEQLTFPGKPKVVVRITETNMRRMVQTTIGPIDRRRSIVVWSRRDHLVTVCLGIVAQTPENARQAHISLQGRKSRMDVNNFVKVLSHWASFFKMRPRPFIDMFAALFEMTRASFRGRLGLFTHTFDMWACSQSFLALTTAIVDRRTFISTYHKLLRLHVANFQPTPLTLTKPDSLPPPSPELAKAVVVAQPPRAVQGLSGNVRLQLDHALRDDGSTAPVLEAKDPGPHYDAHLIAVWLPTPLFQHPPTLYQSWRAWLSGFRLTTPAMSERKSNAAFVSRMIQHGAPWPEIVECLTTRELVAKLQAQKELQTGAGNIFRVRFVMNSTQYRPLRGAVNNFTTECLANPWRNVRDLISYEETLTTLKNNVGWFEIALSAQAPFASDSVYASDFQGIYVEHFLRDIAFTLKEADDTRVDLTAGKDEKYTVPHRVAGESLETALAYSQNNSWFITVQFPWLANYCANAWQLYYLNPDADAQILEPTLPSATDEQSLIELSKPEREELKSATADTAANRKARDELLHTYDIDSVRVAISIMRQVNAETLQRTELEKNALL